VIIISKIYFPFCCLNMSKKRSSGTNADDRWNPPPPNQFSADVPILSSSPPAAVVWTERFARLRTNSFTQSTQASGKDAPLSAPGISESAQSLLSQLGANPFQLNVTQMLHKALKYRCRGNVLGRGTILKRDHFHRGTSMHCI
jgi:hypothetical protein